MTFRVTHARLREFSSATGETDPIYFHRDSAEAQDLPDVMAPPTWVIVVIAPALERFLNDEGFSFGADVVVHSTQRFDYRRPVCAGQDLDCDLTLERRRVRGVDTILDVVATVREHVTEEVLVIAHTTVLIRSADAAQREVS